MLGRCLGSGGGFGLTGLWLAQPAGPAAQPHPPPRPVQDQPAPAQITDHQTKQRMSGCATSPAEPVEEDKVSKSGNATPEQCQTSEAPTSVTPRGARGLAAPAAVVGVFVDVGITARGVGAAVRPSNVTGEQAATAVARPTNLMVQKTICCICLCVAGNTARVNQICFTTIAGNTVPIKERWAAGHNFALPSHTSQDGIHPHLSTAAGTRGG